MVPKWYQKWTREFSVSDPKPSGFQTGRREGPGGAFGASRAPPGRVRGGSRGGFRDTFSVENQFAPGIFMISEGAGANLHPGRAVVPIGHTPKKKIESSPLYLKSTSCLRFLLANVCHWSVGTSEHRGIFKLISRRPRPLKVCSKHMYIQKPDICRL